MGRCECVGTPRRPARRNHAPRPGYGGLVLERCWQVSIFACYFLLVGNLEGAGSCTLSCRGKVVLPSRYPRVLRLSGGSDAIDNQADRGADDEAFSHKMRLREDNDGSRMLKERSRSPSHDRREQMGGVSDRMADRDDDRYDRFPDSKRGFEDQGRYDYDRDDHRARRDYDRYDEGRGGGYGRDEGYARGPPVDRWSSDGRPWRDRPRDYEDIDRRPRDYDEDRWGGRPRVDHDDEGGRWDSREHSRDRGGWGRRGREPMYQRDRRDDRRDGGSDGLSRGSDGLSLLVRNLDRRTPASVIWRAFERHGRVRDVYLPRDYFTRRPKGFAFVQFFDHICAKDALRYMDGERIDGQAVSICYAQQLRKTPDEMKRLRRSGVDKSTWRDRRYRGPPRGRSLSPRYADRGDDEGRTRPRDDDRDRGKSDGDDEREMGGWDNDQKGDDERDGEHREDRDGEHRQERDGDIELHERGEEEHQHQAMDEGKGDGEHRGGDEGRYEGEGKDKATEDGQAGQGNTGEL